MMNDKDFWLTVRAALIMFIRAIEKRYGFGVHTDTGDDKTNVVR